MDAGVRRGTLPTADVEAKLRRLTTVNFNNHNWSWLLNLNILPVPPVIPRVPASGKGQLAPELKEFIQEDNNPDSEMESTRGVSQPIAGPGS